MSSEIVRKENSTPAVVQADSDSIMAVITKAASDPTTDVTKLEKLLGMYERITTRNAEMAFNSAMADAQAKMRPVAADATNPQTRSKYASYAALDKALRPVYTEHGFALSFGTEDGAPADWVRVVCYVSHRDGHTRPYHVDMPADGKGAKGGDVMTKTHAAGSAMSYGMRYLLKLIFNVAVGEDDDDGNAASVPRISAKQAADLDALIDEVGADKSAFLRYLKLNRLEDLPAMNLGAAVKMLEAKRAQKK